MTTDVDRADGVCVIAAILVRHSVERSSLCCGELVRKAENRWMTERLNHHPVQPRPPLPAFEGLFEGCALEKRPCNGISSSPEDHADGRDG